MPCWITTVYNCLSLLQQCIWKLGGPKNPREKMHRKMKKGSLLTLSNSQWIILPNDECKWYIVLLSEKKDSQIFSVSGHFCNSQSLFYGYYHKRTAMWSLYVHQLFVMGERIKPKHLQASHPFGLKANRWC